MTNTFKSKTCDTHFARIYIAGPIQQAEQICREFVLGGLCVNVYSTNYIFKYGEQLGVVVEIINYPRFPKTPQEIDNTATQLGFKLAQEMHQGSFTIQTSTGTTYHDRRD